MPRVLGLGVILLTLLTGCGFNKPSGRDPDKPGGQKNPNPNELMTEYSLGDDGTIETLAYAPDGKTVAVGKGNQVLLWDVAAKKERAALKGHDSAVKWVAFSPDGK